MFILLCPLVVQASTVEWTNTGPAMSVEGSWGQIAAIPANSVHAVFVPDAIVTAVADNLTLKDAAGVSIGTATLTKGGSVRIVATSTSLVIVSLVGVDTVGETLAGHGVEGVIWAFVAGIATMTPLFIWRFTHQTFEQTL